MEHSYRTSQVTYVREIARNLAKRIDEYVTAYNGRKLIIYHCAVEHHGRELHTIDVRMLSSMTRDPLTRDTLGTTIITEMKSCLTINYDWCM